MPQPMQQQAAPAPQQGGSSGAPASFGELVSQIYNNLGMLQQVIGKARPELAKDFAAVQEMFAQKISALQGEGKEVNENIKKPEGAASPEAGSADVMPM